jgi:UDP-N-acetylmuramoyl-tripeptide--D-alanyl-D-alanine ligase
MPTFIAQELAEWCGGEWSAAPAALIEGVCNNTRCLMRGNLYVAIKGERFDGHAFVEEAFHRGAAGAVVNGDCGLSGSPDRPLLVVEDTLEALKSIAGGYRRKVAPLVVGITGSAGKSTVKEMTANVLARRGVTGHTLGNWNNDIGLPLSLLSMEADARYGVFEVGMNHPGETAELCRVLEPDWGVVTNVGPVHIEFFDSVEAIAEEKAALPRSLPDDGRVVLNRDGGFFDVLSQSAACSIVTVSFRDDADFVGQVESVAAGVFQVREEATGETCRLCLPVPGAYNMANALQAVAVGRGAGLDWPDIREALESFHGMPMRWEELDLGGITVINDAYNANPLGMRAAIDTFGEMCVSGAKWLVLGDMLELGEDAAGEHAALGQYLAQGEWGGIITVGELAAVLSEAAGSAGFDPSRVYHCRENEEVASLLGRVVLPGDTVFLKGSRGMRLEEVADNLRQEQEAVPQEASSV